MAKSYEEVELKTLNKGAIADLFKVGWERLMANIGDVNTAPDKPRKMTLTIEVKPDKGRENATTKVGMALGLAPILASEGTIVLDGDGLGQVRAFTSMVKEQELEFETPKKEEVASGKR